MRKGVLINEIELSYSPMTAYHFNNIIKDKDFIDTTFNDSHVYIIAQRKELIFTNFKASNELYLSFDIGQENSSKVVSCRLPLQQENITLDLSEIINLEFRAYYTRSSKRLKTNTTFNKSKISSFFLCTRDTESKVSKSLAWFSPDKLLQNYWKGHILCEFSSELSNFLDYKVHYVGKSTEQNICKRLSNHSTFQEILINETSMSYGSIPSNEIMILLFRIKDSNTVVTFGKESTAKEISNYMTEYLLPSKKTISLDMEKALIKHLQPKYNKIIYKSFPNKDDLVNTDYHDMVFYTFSDPITLSYENGKIIGGQLDNERDYIVVENK